MYRNVCNICFSTVKRVDGKWRHVDASSEEEVMHPIRVNFLFLDEFLEQDRYGYVPDVTADGTFYNYGPVETPDYVWGSNIPPEGWVLFTPEEIASEEKIEQELLTEILENPGIYVRIEDPETKNWIILQKEEQ